MSNELAAKCESWAAEMHRSADALDGQDQLGDAAKGTREVATTLERAAEALRSPPTDAVQGDVVALLRGAVTAANALVHQHEAHCDNVGEQLEPEDQVDFDHWKRVIARIENTLTGTPPPQPAVEQDVKQHIEALKRLKRDIPAYMGDAPKAKHYQWLHNGLDVAIAALSQPAKPDADARALDDIIAEEVAKLTPWSPTDTTIRLVKNVAAHLSRAQSGDTQQDGWQGRYITTWRKTGEEILDWGHYVSRSEDELKRVIENLKTQGVMQWHTYRLGEMVNEYTVEWARTNTDGSTEADDGEG